MILRLKEIFLATGETTVSATINGNVVTKKVTVLPRCENDIIVKYLDRNGFYRFYPFSGRFKEQLNIKSIGNIINITNTKKTIGYNAIRQIIASAIVEERFFRSLKDIFVSPAVYLKLPGTSNYITAKINDGNYFIRKSKGAIYNIEITFELPDYNTIKR